MYRITALICSALISVTSILGAAFVPTFPYIPPMDVTVLDMIHNIYGLTTPQIENSQKRLETYWNAYRAIMGSAFDSFQSELQETIQNTKTSNTIFIGTTLNQQLVEVMKQIKNNGYEYSESGEVTPPPVTVAEIKQWFKSKGYENIDSVINELYNYNNRITDKVYVIIRPNNTLSGTQSVSFMACQNNNAGWYIEPNDGNTWCFQGTSSNRLYYSYVNSFGTYNFETKAFSRSGGAMSSFGAGMINGYTYSLNSTVITSADSDLETKSVQALSNSVVQALDNETMIPITADTVVENGAIDDTKPVVVRMPSTWPTPADEVSELNNVLDDIGVIPATDDVTQAVQQLKEAETAKYGDSNDYTLDLTRYFPFCLPFDISRILAAFVAEPEAPSFTYTINNPFSEDAEDDIILEIDLSVFDDLAAVLRTLETIMFVLGLAVVTRSLYLRG